eukprot:TRINITY_DN65560_c0_g1_i1.p1 TRINITY_DN65560_c0_g1~~TRINITY_DN65560_c0_g1_i1.p1  ORF type:complete len:306 (-),score=59.17 TRINITY_DN65560_c0_g1_i1:313-1230(-)
MMPQTVARPLPAQRPLQSLRAQIPRKSITSAHSLNSWHLEGFLTSVIAGLTVARTCHSRIFRCQRKGTKASLLSKPTAKEELLGLLDTQASGWDESRVNAAQRVEDLVSELAAGYQSKEKPAGQAAQKLLEGRWRLLSTFTPGQAAANLFSLKSWQEYIFEKGPSPVQAAAFTSGAVQRVYQALDFQASPGRWYNVIDASPFGIVCLEAELLSEDDGMQFQWTGGSIVVRRPPWAGTDMDQPLRLPYPVPFALLGDRARGTFATMYLDEDLRISRGSKSGSVFVLARESGKLPMEEEYYNVDAAK